MKHAILSFVLLTAPLFAEKRAVVIGIDDYTASTLAVHASMEHRGGADLLGAANDAGILREMLVRDYGFAPGNVVTLTNQQATRAAILHAIEQHLVQRARPGDIAFFYFAGHGSQVPNALSDELDRLDESIVPADSRLGAPDIRDKELRPLFNRILDRGAHLTLLLDHCHSGSAFRGARVRGIRPARPIRDARDYGPRPEERGALVFAATQDADDAREARGDDGKMHGAFTWAWIRALRDAGRAEPVRDTFLRAQARLRGERPSQAPVMLGPIKAQLRPFLSDGVQRGRARIAVERVDPDGTVVLQGGFANGLAAGTKLRDGNSTLRVTHIAGPGRSVARLETGTPVSPGALVKPATRVRAWHTLPSPEPTPYHLGLRRESTQTLVRDGRVTGGETYSIVLRPSDARGVDPARRYYYVVVIDSAGGSHLVFPRSGSLENRFAWGNAEIALGPASAFRVVAPYGVDTYVLLSIDEPLPDPKVLVWDGLRAIRLPSNRWSIERVSFLSAAWPRKSVRLSSRAERGTWVGGARRACLSPLPPRSLAPLGMTRGLRRSARHFSR